MKFDFKLSEYFPTYFKNKVRPISQIEMEYYRLLQTVNRGDLFSVEDLRLIRRLPRENLLTLLKLYNINIHNLHLAVNSTLTLAIEDRI